jgi:hypothetical protein
LDAQILERIKQLAQPKKEYEDVLGKKKFDFFFIFVCVCVCFFFFFFFWNILIFIKRIEEKEAHESLTERVREKPKDHKPSF